MMPVASLETGSTDILSDDQYPSSFLIPVNFSLRANTHQASRDRRRRIAGERRGGHWASPAITLIGRPDVLRIPEGAAATESERS
jgi:hypothetical protein